jgi:hypothetical protein
MNCLNDLIKFKDYCDANQAGPFVSDFVDVSTVFLAHLANDSEQSGKEYANSLIQGAREQVYADILLSASNGYSINSVVYHYNNTCRFSETYTNWGIALTNYFRSSNSKIHLSEIRFKADFTGQFNIVVDDGVTQTVFSADAIQRQEVVLPVEYSTINKQIKIYAQDSALKFAMLSCSSGGCGSCAAKRGVYIQQQGYNRSSLNTQPSGFIPSAYIACDMDSVMCNVINRHRALFSKALAYKVGIMAYMRFLITPRLNDTTLNIDRDAVQLYLNTLEAKYKELMWGSVPAYGNASTTGIIKIMQDSYRSLNDQCVVCSSQINTATAVF